MEKLSYSDAFVMELIVDKINAVINECENLRTENEALNERISRLWKYLRLQQEKAEKAILAEKEKAEKLEKEKNTVEKPTVKE